MPLRRGDPLGEGCRDRDLVSIHAPAKGRPRRQTWSGPCRCFDPRRREGATVALRHGALASRVSIHAPAKGRPRAYDPDLIRQVFRSTPPRRGDRSFTGVRIGATMFRSTPPRRGDSSPVRRRSPSCMFRSTPPRRGDTTTRRQDLELPEFRSTPREGATCGVQAIDAPSRCFDPRPREGATGRMLCAVAGIVVSIHAPAKGRPHMDSVIHGTCRFDPRPREGAT